MQLHHFAFVLTAVGSLFMAGCRTTQPLPSEIRTHHGELFGSMEVIDPMFFALIPAATPIEKLASGFDW